ncbi:AAA family ATPase [Escherichia coli]|uniref:AAA family ATPase n=1 Tax=Escherichia coli TaxID=562 RepID=UPI000A2DE74B|nr:AAA family ATPase [Escherichia coli]EFJ5714058.1 AAA family ATPase [Escherichia coli]OTE44068.1 AAA family ATPase [Escherichia coli]
MIESISVSQAGSYGNDVQYMMPLMKINYIYGSNGAGKTTISKIIHNALGFPTCQIKWKNNNQLTPYVYNRDFVVNNFSGDSIKGIFTLGEETKELTDNIDKLIQQRDKEQSSIDSKKRNLNNNDNANLGIYQKLEKIELDFKNDCWNQKKKHDDYFYKAFEGLRSSQEKFKSKVLEELYSKEVDLHQLPYLISKAGSVYSDSLTVHNIIPLPNFSNIKKIVDDEIWKEKILGKEDASVAEIIRQLDNSDWVKEGIKYYDNLETKCPFCQQNTPSSLKSDLESYFDTKYLEKTESINVLLKNYTHEYRLFDEYVAKINEGNYAFLDLDLFNTKSKLILSILSRNIDEAKRKLAELSTPVAMTGLLEPGKELLDIILAANNQVFENNELYKNRSMEREKLTKEIWHYIVKVELADKINKYNTDKEQLNRAKEGLIKGLEKDKVRLDDIIENISSEESKRTSVTPTITAINKILLSFGFKNFSLAPTSDSFSYRIVRENGDNALSTLSEGEKTFITFLYFYNLIKGSNSTSGVMNDRVVVFDDPISSLDSDILFIVSSLMKKLIKDIRDNNGRIKQVFFLTHNIYFHKELTFDMNRNLDTARPDETFWVIRKKDKLSFIESHACNPIKTSYDLLWSEIRRPDINCTTVQNTMRRILENYFKILGGFNVWKLEKHFDGDEKIAFNSLISWINDGSHHSNDDLYIALDQNSVSKNLNIFQKIFEYSDNAAHYKMMMGEYYKALPNDDDINVDVQQSANDDQNVEVI